jgi:membrane protease YdiL (CAAX protease family)
MATAIGSTPPTNAPMPAAANVPHDPHRILRDLITIVAIIAIGTLASSTFAIGVGVGVLESLVFFPAFALAAKCAGMQPFGLPPNYNTWMSNCVAPIVEECLFRSVIQPLAEKPIAYILPALTVEILGAQFALATLVTIVVTSLLFGVSHLFNGHPNASSQAIHATLGGVLLGIVAVHFGLLASISAHMVHNTTAGALGAYAEFA